MNIIEASGLGKRYGSTWALRECSLGLPGQGRSALPGCAASSGAVKLASSHDHVERGGQIKGDGTSRAGSGTNRLVPADQASDRLVIGAARRIGGLPPPEPCAQVRILLGTAT